MRDLLVELVRDGVVLIESASVEEFIFFSHKNHVYPLSGEIIQNGQFFYI